MIACRTVASLLSHRGGAAIGSLAIVGGFQSYRLEPRCKIVVNASSGPISGTFAHRFHSDNWYTSLRNCRSTQGETVIDSARVSRFARGIDRKFEVDGAADPMTSDIYIRYLSN